MKPRKDETTMPRMTASEAGRRGGLIGGRSRSTAKLAAARRNGFQPQTPQQEVQQQTAVEKVQQNGPTPALFIPAQRKATE
jgi:hypothetical protein